jgi:hypothetical protein
MLQICGLFWPCTCSRAVVPHNCAALQMLMQQQQTSKNRPQRAGSNAGNHTPTLVPIPLSEDIERMGESPDNLKLNVSSPLLLSACCICCVWWGWYTMCAK